MKIRNQRIIYLLVISAFLFILQTGHVSAIEVIKWKMPTGYTTGTTFWEYIGAPFANHVKILSEGRLIIEPFAAGTIAPAFKVTETVKNRIAEAGNTWAPYEVGKDPTTVLFGGGPGGLNSEKMLHWYYEYGGEDLLGQWRLETSGVVSFLLGMFPTEVGAHSHKPIRSLNDFKGLKMRTTGAWAEIIPKFGASVVTLPGAEVFPALEKKVIDATEWADPGTNFPLGFHQVAKYIIFPGIHQPSAPWELVINPEAWKKLPSDLKEIVKASARLATFESWVKLGEASRKAMIEFQKSGNVIIVLDDEVIKKAQQLGDEWCEANAAKNAWMKKVYESQKAFRSTWDKYSSVARAK
jgi:TRAP-type mannitol/chloroaromatic compound transport system substrate-binding protein